MPAPIIPWQPSNIPGEIQAELNRRRTNRSFKYVQNTQANWDKSGDWNAYKGPMVSWIRFCSNSGGHPLNKNQFGDTEVHDDGKKERFVLFSGKGFYDSYGFSPPKNVGGAKQQVIGYTPGLGHKGIVMVQPEPHIIENSLITPSSEPGNYPIHVPPPEISRMEVTVQKELFRRAQIEWVCFSWKQLVYMTPYFLVPGITCMVEWGWNHYNAESLVDISDRNLMQELWDNAYPLYTDNIIKSKGNYDVIYGIVTNFNWSIEGNKIICTTEITSKDRLYAGIAVDYSLSVKDEKKADEAAGIFKSIRDFVKEDSTLTNLKTLVSQAPVVTGQTLVLTTNTKGNDVWRDILQPLLSKGTPEQIGMKLPHVFGIFSGRPRNSYTKDPIDGAKGVFGEGFGPPSDKDFDAKIQDKDSGDKFWINMGMVVALLNHFSAAPSGAVKGKNMFEVDIQNSVIGAHPNLISCDPKVLIPNYQAPKFLYGLVGLQYNAGVDKDGSAAGLYSPTKGIPYTYQILRRVPIGTSIPNRKLKQLLFQPDKDFCYRDNIDDIINYNRYRYASVGAKAGILPLNSFSFPSSFDSKTPLPVSPRGLAGDKLEKDRSGLLSNIYISYATLKDIILDTANESYTQIYTAIFKVLMESVDGFWDLALMDTDGTITVTDRKYVSRFAIQEQGDPVYAFDYYDADSIIKSLKFRPVMSDAQATRVIYGQVNNKDSKYRYYDKNDVLDYQFKDCVIGTAQNKAQGKDGDGEIERRKTAKEQLKDLVRGVQSINGSGGDFGLQMSLAFNRKGKPSTAVISAPGTRGGITIAPDDMPEIVKLVMPNQQLLRLLLNDDDEENNGRYCAVQPGIILELTLQGIGGLRTFQYFLVNNLPEPYSARDIIFRVTDVHQTLEAGNWETTIRAQPLPLRAYIKNRLTGPWSKTTPTI